MPKLCFPTKMNCSQPEFDSLLDALVFFVCWPLANDSYDGNDDGYAADVWEDSPFLMMVLSLVAPPIELEILSAIGLVLHF